MLNINEIGTNIGANGNSMINDACRDLCMRMMIRPTDQLHRMYAISNMINGIVAYAKDQELDFVAVEDNNDKEVVVGLIAVLRHAARYYEANNEKLSKASMKLKRFISEKGIKTKQAAEAVKELEDILVGIAPCTIDLEDENIINKLFTNTEYLDQLIVW